MLGEVAVDVTVDCVLALVGVNNKELGRLRMCRSSEQEREEMAEAHTMRGKVSSCSREASGIYFNVP